MPSGSVPGSPLPECSSAFLGARLHAPSPATSILSVGPSLHTQPCGLSRERQLAKSPRPPAPSPSICPPVSTT